MQQDVFVLRFTPLAIDSGGVNVEPCWPHQRFNENNDYGVFSVRASANKTALDKGRGASIRINDKRKLAPSLYIFSIHPAMRHVAA